MQQSIKTYKAIFSTLCLLNLLVSMIVLSNAFTAPMVVKVLYALVAFKVLFFSHAYFMTRLANQSCNTCDNKPLAHLNGYDQNLLRLSDTCHCSCSSQGKGV